MAGLRKLGYRVLSLATIGRGVPDLLIGTTDGRLVLLEVKLPKGKLTEDQAQFLDDWRGLPVHVVRSVAEAVSLLRVSDD